METVSKSHLKAHMLAIFRRLEDSGSSLVVTDRGRAVLRIEPVQVHERVEEVFADVRGRCKLPDRAELEAPLLDEWHDHWESA